MIELTCIKSPHSNYLGKRSFQQNNITLGPSGDIKILPQDFPLPEIKINVIDDQTLLFQSDSTNEPLQLNLLVNHKRQELPFQCKHNDIIGLEGFLFEVSGFKISTLNNFSEELNKQIEKIKKTEKPLYLFSKKIAKQLN